MALTPAVFLDKDGTVLVDEPYNVDPARMRFAPGAYAGLCRLGAMGVPLVVVSNQPGVGLGYFDEPALKRVHEALSAMFRAAGAHLTGFYYCPHLPEGPDVPACACRKPAPGLLLRAARNHDVDLQRSWMIGDILNDVEAGNRAGCRTVLLDVGNETEWLRGPHREPAHRAPDFDAAARVVMADLFATCQEAA
ncbi:D-glycero-alpha-D-manno-heptose-1,7-bisphosphate 7-phosphatase [Bordetella genomosp. 13]|uniref:D-glycero-alpha-D-manno-heptose-1,7-bisphosphate 7-phosphatase n=1 Tax=Bordetella genomosp. 13 TaxID=463040 RepID=UPI00119F7484|nr:HAD family hydrolase [Bordetella genomosp. 13]